jgi:peptide/nickel transport system ATP-binding protein
MSLLSLHHVGVQRGSRWVLRGVSFEVQAGQALGIVGESGAGKTTLLNAVLGLLEPQDGEIHLKGQAWSGLPEGRRRSRRALLQAVFQDPHASLPPHLTGWEILMEPLDIHHRGDRAERREAAARMAARVKFPATSLDQRPARWSGGLAQRLCLARALMLGPELLVLDEPLSALDPTLAGHLLELLLELKAEGMAMLFVSHHLPAVQRLCERMLVLYGGEPMTQGQTGELLANLRHPYLRGLWGAIPDLDSDVPPRAWGNQVLREVRAGGCLLFDRCPRAQDACKKAPSLESQERCHFPHESN